MPLWHPLRSGRPSEDVAVSGLNAGGRPRDIGRLPSRLIAIAGSRPKAAAIAAPRLTAQLHCAYNFSMRRVISQGEINIRSAQAAQRRPNASVALSQCDGPVTLVSIPARGSISCPTSCIGHKRLAALAQNGIGLAGGASLRLGARSQVPELLQGEVIGLR